MQSLVVLLLSSLTLVVTNPTITSAPTCTLGNDICPTSSYCSLTRRCGGLCLTTTPIPPPIPCTLGNDAPCPTNWICTPTQYCPTATAAPCGGQCIATTQPPFDNSTLPTVPCVIGGPSVCTGNSFCTQTEVCEGLCATATATVSPTPSASGVPCGGTPGRQCGKGEKCLGPDGKHCGAQPGCYGVCVSD